MKLSITHSQLKIHKLLIILITCLTCLATSNPVQAKTHKSKFNAVHYSQTYQAPVINNFSQTVLDKYKLEGNYVANRNLTYNDSTMPAKLQKYNRTAIKALNALNIVHLTKQAHKSDINIKVDNSDPRICGLNSTYEEDDSHNVKNLAVNIDAHITLNVKAIKGCVKSYRKSPKIYRLDYAHYYEQTLLHEIGHALGLDHNQPVGKSVMSGARILTSYKAPLLDKDYVKRLKLIYDNMN